MHYVAHNCAELVIANNMLLNTYSKYLVKIELKML